MPVTNLVTRWCLWSVPLMAFCPLEVPCSPQSPRRPVHHLHTQGGQGGEEGGGAGWGRREEREGAGKRGEEEGQEGGGARGKRGRREEGQEGRGAGRRRGKREEGQEGGGVGQQHSYTCACRIVWIASSTCKTRPQLCKHPSSSNTAVVHFILLSPLPCCEVSNFAQVIPACEHTLICTCTRARTRACTCTRTHTCTHTFEHTQQLYPPHLPTVHNQLDSVLTVRVPSHREGREWFTHCSEGGGCAGPLQPCQHGTCTQWNRRHSVTRHAIRVWFRRGS